MERELGLPAGDELMVPIKPPPVVLGPNVEVAESPLEPLSNSPSDRPLENRQNMQDKKEKRLYLKNWMLTYGLKRAYLGSKVSLIQFIASSPPDSIKALMTLGGTLPSVDFHKRLLLLSFSTAL